MFRLIKSAFSFLFVVSLVLFIFFWIKKEHYTEKWLSKQLQTEVTIGSISLDGFGIKIRHFIIDNPLGFPSQLNAFEADNICLKFSLKSIIRKRLEISSVKIHNAIANVLFYNKHATGHNWTHLLSKDPYESHNLKTFIKKCEIRSLACSVYKLNKKKPVPCLIPHSEFYSKQYLDYSFQFPSLSQAVKSLLYLMLEEAIYKSTTNAFCLDETSVASEAHYFFESSYSHFSKQAFSHNIEAEKKSSWTQENKTTLDFLKEIFFR